MSKPVYLGLSLLDISKTVMCEFWYDYVKSKYGENGKFCYIRVSAKLGKSGKYQGILIKIMRVKLGK